jgi:PAT family beta-lactamase induction signal transducer AmpG
VPLDSTARRDAIRPVLRWVFRRQMVPVVLFVLLYKVGDSTLGRMVKPFWVDRGYSLTEIGAISVTLGTVLTILGALAGGWVVNRIGIFRSLLWLGLAQLVSNLGYVVVAAIELPRESIYAASMIESFTQGLGTAAFLSFLMSLCDREHAATQYAMLSALFALTRDVAGAFTGLGVDAFGYPVFFVLTTALALPALALLPLVRPRIGEGSLGEAGLSGSAVDPE